jgi:hypothetical protein
MAHLRLNLRPEAFLEGEEGGAKRYFGVVLTQRVFSLVDATAHCLPQLQQL